MNISLLSKRYIVQKLQTTDAAKVFELCRKNPLYYQFCPPFVSVESIIADMKALPPGKEMRDKYYLGYYAEKKLIAVMDLIIHYPDKNTVFIGFFMTDVSVQNTGVGSRIMDELCDSFRKMGIQRIRLGWVKGNPQAEHFWHKTNFIETGAVYDTGSYTVINAERNL